MSTKIIFTKCQKIIAVLYIWPRFTGPLSYPTERCRLQTRLGIKTVRQDDIVTVTVTVAWNDK